MSLTLRLAHLIHASEPDPAALAAARDGLLDYLAVAFAGARDPGVQALRSALGATAGPAVVLGSPTGLDPLSASLVNGYIAHVLDYDDVHFNAGGHPSAVIVSALLAAACEAPVSGKDLLTAYVIGLETMTVLARAIGRRHYAAGFHSTATLGGIAAAAASARLLGLPAPIVATALGIAATQAAGLRVHFGTDVKPLHAGLAARAGLFSTRLAAAGLAGSEEALAGELGLLAVLGLGEAQDPSAALDTWGAPWQITAPGLKFKRYPCCAGTHRVADAVFALLHQHPVHADQVAQVNIHFFAGRDRALIHRRPSNGIEGKFSIEYVVARQLLDGGLGVNEFTAAPVPHAVQQLIGRVHRQYWPVEDEPAGGQYYEHVEIVLKDGTRLLRIANHAANVDDLAAKFNDATGHDPALADIPAQVAGLDSRHSLQHLLRRLAGQAA